MPPCRNICQRMGFVKYTIELFKQEGVHRLGKDLLKATRLIRNTNLEQCDYTVDNCLKKEQLHQILRELNWVDRL